MRRYSGPRHLIAGCATPYWPLLMNSNGLTTILSGQAASLILASSLPRLAAANIYEAGSMQYL